MTAALIRLVRERAGERCEYCLMPQSAYRVRFQVDHVVAQQHKGPTVPENLALACLACNSHKGPNLSGIDPDSGDVVRLFNPRAERWEDHFEWSGAELIGKTPTGRATIAVLAINDPAYVITRRQLMNEGEVFQSERG